MAVAGIAIVWMLSITWIYCSLFPYVYIYYSPLIGGVTGARQFFGENEVTDYWAVSYRQGMEWINQNAPEGSKVCTPVAGYLVEMTAPLWMRNDLSIFYAEDIQTIHAQEGVVYILLLYRPMFWDDLAMDIYVNHVPVKQFKVEGQTVLLIYEMDSRN